MWMDVVDYSLTFCTIRRASARCLRLSSAYTVSVVRQFMGVVTRHWQLVNYGGSMDVRCSLL